MLRGEYRYNLDEKGRVVLPPKLRRQMGETVIVTRGFDGCIAVYSTKEWATVEKDLSRLPLGRREFQRFVLAPAQDVDVDRQGRITLPEALRDYAGISKEVVIVGLVRRLEIWSEAHWKEAVARAQREAPQIAAEIDISL